MPASATFEQAAARARHFCWLERRMFEVLGGWVPTVAEPEAKLLLRTHSFQHAWHAQLWEELLPVGAGVPGGEHALSRVLEAVEEPTSTAERLAGVYQVVLPRLIDAYQSERAGAGQADGPTVRALRLILADDVDAVQEGALLLESLSRSAPDVMPHVGRLEGLLADTKGIDIT